MQLPDKFLKQFVHLLLYIVENVTRREHIPLGILTMNPYKTLIRFGLFKVHLPYINLELYVSLVDVLRSFQIVPVRTTSLAPEF